MRGSEREGKDTKEKILQALRQRGGGGGRVREREDEIIHVKMTYTVSHIIAKNKKTGIA